MTGAPPTTQDARASYLRGDKARKRAREPISQDIERITVVVPNRARPSGSFPEVVAITLSRVKWMERET